MTDFLVEPQVACQLLGVSTPTLARYAKRGQLRAQLTPGGHRRYFVSDLAVAAGKAGDDKFLQYAKEIAEGYKCKV